MSKSIDELRADTSLAYSRLCSFHDFIADEVVDYVDAKIALAIAESDILPPTPNGGDDEPIGPQRFIPHDGAPPPFGGTQ